MSARMFFTRYPDLYGFLLSEMTSIAEIVRNSENAVTPEESAIYPTLIVLAKLHPVTRIDKEDEKFQVNTRDLICHFFVVILSGFF